MLCLGSAVSPCDVPARFGKKGNVSLFLQKMVKCLQQRYEVSTQLMEKPGDEVSFLKRRMTLQHDDRITIETHHKHVDQMCSLLG